MKSVESLSIFGFRIQEKVKGIGFDWENKSQVWEKVLEEIEELKMEIESGNQGRIELWKAGFLGCARGVHDAIASNPDLMFRWESLPRQAGLHTRTFVG